MCGEIQRCMSTSDCVVHHSEIYCRGMEEGSGPGEARGGHVDIVKCGLYWKRNGKLKDLSKGVAYMI